MAAQVVMRGYPTNTILKVNSEPSCCYLKSNPILKGSTNWIVPHPHSKDNKYKVGDFLAQSNNNNSNTSRSTEDVQLKEKNHLATEFGWKVRRLGNNREDIRNAATVQALAFHQPSPLFDDFFFDFFQAEVLSGLIYKLRNSPPDRYACLVAEAQSRDDIISIIDTQPEEQVVGVVDVTALRDQNVLQNLPPDAHEYLYVSGIAVLSNFRRKKIGTVLLKACDTLSMEWGFKYLVLRAYEDDYGARELYSNAGYTVVSGDPPWFSTWIGRKRRVLMIKQLTLPPSHKPSFN